MDKPVADVDTPLHVEVSGLAPSARVTVSLAADDASGVTWRSAAQFTSSPQGVVDLSRDAPASGSYSGVAAMGLFWSMKPVGGPASDTDFAYAHDGFSATLQTLVGGRVVASTTLRRRAQAPGVAVLDERVANAGFYGELYVPAGGGGRRPGVVVVGGSEGGLAVDAIARLLASDGYPSLALAYFDEPGLPTGITGIPLEYFASAIHWVASRPEVDPSRVSMVGISRGAEASLLVASYFPSLLRGVVAAGPTSVVNPPQPGPRGSAWTFEGQPLAGIPPGEFGIPNPPDAPDAVIPVARFPGRLMLLCGTADAAWPACDYASSIEEERGRQSAGDTVARVPGAGHGVASLVPYISEAGTAGLGGDPIVDGAGRATAWSVLLRFLGS